MFAYIFEPTYRILCNSTLLHYFIKKAIKFPPYLYSWINWPDRDFSNYTLHTHYIHCLLINSTGDSIN